MAGELILEMLSSLKTFLIYGWPFILLLWLFAMKMMWKKWPVDVVIIEKRGKNLIKTNDRAGRYVDKFTGITGYKLQKAGDTMPILNYDWVLHNAFKPTTLFDKLIHLLRGDIGTVFLFRYGSKQYKPIRIKDNLGKMILKYREIKNNNGEPIIVPIYEQLDPRNQMGALDFVVVDWDNINFMVQEQRAVIERTTKKNDWIKQIAIPIVILAITAVVCIVMIKFSFDYAAAIRSGTTDTPTNKPAEVPNIPIISDQLPQ